MERKDYYEILGVSENAGADEIKKTYRKLAFQYHPDRTGNDPESTRRMKEINEAYATLSDPAKRREYDSLRSAYGSTAYDRFRQTYSEEDIFKGSDVNQIFEEFARAFSGFRRPEDFFSRSDYYGPKYRSFEFRRPGFTGRVFFSAGPMGATIRRVREAEGKRSVRTVYRAPLMSRLLARLLEGFGKKLMEELEIPVRGKDLFDTLSVSPQEIGKKIAYRTKRNRGRSKDLLISIPQGIKPGMKMKLTGQGEEGRHGGESGDLYLEIRIETSLSEKIKRFLRKWF
ncbi:MAG: DnaJ domain-containing protein [Nitrospirota bacterium]